MSLGYEDSDIRIFLNDKLPFWKDLTEDQMVQLIKNTLVSRYKKGDMVFNPLKRQAGLKLIRSGVVNIFMASQKGGLLLYRLMGGEVCVLSIFSLLKQFDWDIYMEAEQNAEVLTIQEAYYMQLSEEAPVVRNFNQEILIRRLGEVAHAASHAALAPTEERLARFLIMYQQQNGGNQVAVTHEEIAKSIGTVREVVSRTLKQFEDKGLVRLGRGNVTILDNERLMSLHNGHY